MLYRAGGRNRQLLTSTEQAEKEIRHRDQWEQIEKYISENSLARFSHSLCPDCQVKLYPELFRDL